MDQPPTVQGNLLRHPITALKIHLKMTEKTPTKLFHTFTEMEDARIKEAEVEKGGN